MPYLYSAVRECTKTGMPVMRALWLHYSDDPVAAARGDQYLWGRDLLVAPVVEKGATERRVYLPHGTWHDFWTGERHEGGREITRTVDLETLPLYRARRRDRAHGAGKAVHRGSGGCARWRLLSIPGVTDRTCCTRTTARRFGIAAANGRESRWTGTMPGSH